MIITVPDKLISTVLPKEYIMATDEGEAIGIAAGFYYATKQPADVYISADGFMNALNPITSLVIPEKIEMNLFISIGRTESQHKVATYLVPEIIEELKIHGAGKIHYELIRKQS